MLARGRIVRRDQAYRRWLVIGGGTIKGEPGQLVSYLVSTEGGHNTRESDHATRIVSRRDSGVFEPFGYGLQRSHGVPCDGNHLRHPDRSLDSAATRLPTTMSGSIHDHLFFPRSGRADHTTAIV